MAQNCAMDADLPPVVAALADLDDDHLDALTEAINRVPQVAPGLLAWLEHVVDREINRRRSVDFPLLPPDAAIPPEEAAISLDVAMMLRHRFAEDKRVEGRGVAAPLDAVVRLLGGGEHRH